MLNVIQNGARRSEESTSSNQFLLHQNEKQSHNISMVIICRVKRYYERNKVQFE